MKKLQCVTERQLIKMVQEGAKNTTLAGWAADNGVQPSAPSAFVRRVQPAGKQIPAAFGLVPITVFVPKDDPNYFEYPRRTAAKADAPRAATPTAKDAESKKLKKDLKKSVKAEGKKKKGKKGAKA